MSEPRSRPPGAASSSKDDNELSCKEAAEYIASLLEGGRRSQRAVAFLAYLINVALEEANNEKTIPD